MVGRSNHKDTKTRRSFSCLRVFVVLVCAFISSAVAQQPDPPLKENRLLAVGAPAPDFTLSDAAGAQHTLSAYRGRIVVLDFWATWCGPCAKLMPRMQKLRDKYADRGVLVFGVNAWEQNDPAALMRTKNFTYGLLLKGEEITRAYGIINLPVVYVIGADGRIVYGHEGVDGKDLGGLIEKQLKAAGAN